MDMIHGYINATQLQFYQFYHSNQSKDEYIQNLQNKYNFEVIIGGPPCQGFSNSGNRDVNDPRNSLFMEYVRFVKHFKPKFFVMENVQGILSMKTKTGALVKDLILSEFKNLGYNVDIHILRSSSNVNLDAILGYKTKDKKISFMDEY